MESARQSNVSSKAEPVPAPGNGVVPGVPAAAEAPPKRKARPFLILGVIAAAALAGVGGYALLTAGHEQTDDAQVAADMVPVAARVAGAVPRVALAENQPVKEGGLLA